MRYPSLIRPVIIAMIIIAMPLYLGIVAATFPLGVLEIVHEESGDLVFWTRIKTGAIFSLGYTHSVQLSPVVDRFRIDRDFGIVLVSTTFSDHGAGLPDNSYRGAVFSVEDEGGFKIKDMNIFCPEIRLRIGREYNNTFTIRNYHINLSEMYGNASFTIRTRERSLFRCKLRRLLNVG